MFEIYILSNDNGLDSKKVAEDVLGQFKKTDIYSFLELPDSLQAYQTKNLPFSTEVSGTLYYHIQTETYHGLVGKLSTAANLSQLEINIDDMTAEQLATIKEAVLKLGAADSWLEPISMKKSRMGSKLCVICPIEATILLKTWLLNHTTTLGVRSKRYHRLELWRATTPESQEKVYFDSKGSKQSKPEHDKWHKEFLSSFS